MKPLVGQLRLHEWILFLQDIRSGKHPSFTRPNEILPDQFFLHLIVYYPTKNNKHMTLLCPTPPQNAQKQNDVTRGYIVMKVVHNCLNAFQWRVMSHFIGFWQCLWTKHNLEFLYKILFPVSSFFFIYLLVFNSCGYIS